jgi:hypothetical protein
MNVHGYEYVGENKMKLLVAGCSHSAGSELIEPWHPKDATQAYGQHVADALGCTDYVNIAGPGWSNEWIAYTLTEWLEQCEDLDDWFVLIGWTGMARIPAYCDETNEVVHLCPGQHRLSLYSRRIQRAYEHLFATQLPVAECIRIEHTRILNMQMLLKQLNVRYLMFDTVWTNHDLCSDRFIDHARYFRYNDKENDYWSYYKRHYWDGSERWQNHAPAEYHKYWAELLVDHIRTSESSGAHLEDRAQ